MKDSLIGTEVQIVVGEPWDFTDTYGTDPLIGEIVKIGEDSEAKGEAVLIQLRGPIVHDGVQYIFFTATSRYVGPFNELTERLSKKESITCNFLGISNEIAFSENPFYFDYSKKKDYFGIIGSLLVVK